MNISLSHIVHKAVQPSKWVCDFCKEIIQCPEEGNLLIRGGKDCLDCMIVHSETCDAIVREDYGHYQYISLTNLLPLTEEKKEQIAKEYDVSSREGTLQDIFKRLSLCGYEEMRNKNM